MMATEVKTLTVEVDVPIGYVFAEAAEASGGCMYGSDHQDVLERAALVTLARRHAVKAYELDEAIVAAFVEDGGRWDKLDSLAERLTEEAKRLCRRQSEPADGPA